MVAPAVSVASLPATSPSSLRTPPSAHGRPRRSMLHRGSTIRMEEEARRPPLSDNVVLLIQEWLTIAQFPVTLQSFVDEYTRTQHRPPPPLDKWYEMTQAMDLSSLPTTPPLDPIHLTNPALLERIVTQAFTRSRRFQEAGLSKPPATVVVSKRPATAAPSLKFASKRSLPISSSAAAMQSKSLSALPSPAVRPKSAVVSAASRSTTDLEATGGRQNECERPANNNNEDESRPPAKRFGSLSSPPSPDPHTDSTKRFSVQSVKSQQLLTGYEGGGRRQTLKELADSIEKTIAGDARPEVDEFEATVELEDMTEEHLAEHFGAFSKSHIKKLRRVLAKSSAHSQELQRTRTAMDKIQLRAQHMHEQSAFAAKQTALLSTTMDMLIKEPCSLCRVVFLKKNLTTRVSYKSICDLRASWALRKRREREEAKAQAAAAGSLRMAPEGVEGDDDGSDIAVDSAVAMESAQQISHLYDEVPVCAFCAQLALDFSSYRPSSAEQKERKELERRVAMEKQRTRELQRQRDRLKCDPLAFHAYELNSDDDDDDEVLEVDAHGRVQVVRRARNRRRSVARTPAQTGLVSKRIHYNHLRSHSVHALNRKEWEVISQSPTGV